MTSIRRSCVVLCLILCSLPTWAANFSLSNIDDEDMKQIVGDISTNFLHTTVSGASTLGTLFGFELGLIGGQTNTPHINDLVKLTDPTATADKIPHAGLIGILTVPLGITAEMGLLPRLGKEDFRLSSTSVAVKWTPTEILLDWPLSLAVKASYTQSKLAFKQEISNVPISYDYQNKQTAVMVMVSKNLAIVEPYFGFGTVSAKGDLAADVNTVFTSGVYELGAKRTGTIWVVGTELKLLVVKLGAEYTNMFNTSRVTGKLSFYF